MFSKVLPSHILLTLLCQALCYEPTEEEFQCFNDYETEMKCSLESDGVTSCSEYQLNIIHTVVDSFDNYTCIFERSNHSASCECKIKVNGFVLTETFSTTLLKGTNVLLRKTFITMYFIKPKTLALSVQKTENGNFNVTWDDKYEKRKYRGRNFAKSLEINLTYRIEGEHKTVSKKVPNTQAFYEIVGTHLQPNTKYILTARMSTEYNNHTILSDESEPVEFTSSLSPHELVKMLVPILCVGLIIIICTIFICVLRMKINWWDKISKPKLDANLGEGKGYILPPSNINHSSIHVEKSKPDLQEENLISIDTNNERSSHSGGSDDYGRAGFGSGSDKENYSPINVSSRVNHALGEAFISLFSNNTPSNEGTEMVIKRVGISSSRERDRANRDSGNGSDSSVSYLDYHSCQSNKRDIENISCNNCPISDAMEDGYQSFNSVGNQGNDPNADVCLNRSNDVDADEKFIVKSPLYPSPLAHEDSVTPSDDGYQAFEGLTKSTEGQWTSSIRTEQALNESGALKFPHSTGQDPTSSEQQILRATSLHFSIQTEMSYQSV